MPGSVKSYDRAYFDFWYRDGRRRVSDAPQHARRTAFVLAAAEQLLGRRIASVLDVGCGEGTWGVSLKRLRPRLRYVGVDPSAYVVGRYGRARGIRFGSFERLAVAGLSGAFDLAICADVLHYLPDEAIEAGLPHFASRVAGVAYLPLFSRGDAMEGDLDGFLSRDARWYRRRFEEAGLTPVGLHLYAAPGLADELSALERP